jgi:hypothetical protein
MIIEGEDVGVGKDVSIKYELDINTQTIPISTHPYHHPPTLSQLHLTD